MSCNFLLAFCATLFCLYFSTGVAQNRVLRTRFTCQGRPSGYYADVETGCRVYHMCDGLGRQFSYTCPNTTLFQQRMLICDHWYMVNCSKSESDYDANLLIGQRDKPFVSEADMQLRTPRPDILSVPPNNNYYDGLREAEFKGSDHPGNSIVGIPDIISSANNNGLDSAKQNYRPPTSWSTGTSVTQSKRPSQGSFDTGHNDHYDNDNLAGAASQTPGPLFHPTPEDSFSQNTGRPVPSPPPQELLPPATPRTTTEAAEDDYIDIRMKESSEDNEKDAVVKFIKRFDPNSPDSIKTAMSQSEILNLNQHLPAGQSSAEEERTPRKHETSNTANSFNFEGTKGVTETTRFNAVNIKPTSTSFNGQSGIPEPDKDLLPPNADSKPQPSTTVGPPVYYDWKWAVPAFDLTPPKGENVSDNASAAPQTRSVPGKRPFSDVTRPTPTEPDLTPFLHNTEYNISSYFVPDYVFPLDKDHPGYEDDNAQTSFQVNVGKPGRANFGENPACPHCHPAYLKPGSCEPCIVRR